MKDVKIIFLDLDGTLRNNEKRVSERCRKILKKLEEKGIKIIFTTGRSLSHTALINRQFLSGGYVISSNGAEIYNVNTNEVIYNNTISSVNIMFLNELVKKYNLFFTVNAFTKCYTNKLEEDTGLIYQKDLMSLNSLKISQVIIESSSLNNMKLFRRDLSTNGELRIINKSKNITNPSGLLFYDITNSDVSKGVAARYLCDYFNIDYTKTMAVGDSDNDIELLNFVKVKVAMANATDKLKAVANVVTLSNEKDGVAIILEQLYDEITK